MAEDPGSTTDARKFCGQDLLVLTDASRDGRNALALPFTRATVLARTDAEEICVTECFDTIAVDLSSLDLHWLEAAIRRVLPALRPGGRLLVVLDPCGEAAPEPTEAHESSLTNLRWHGLANLDGRPCAVLSVDDRSSAVHGPIAMLKSADTATRIAVGGTVDNRRPADQSDRSRMRHFEARWRSEQALLRRLDQLAEQLEQQHRQHQGIGLVRAVLRRSKPGRAMLRAVRPCQRFARALIARL